MNIPAKIHYTNGTQEDCVIYCADKGRTYFHFRTDKTHFMFNSWVEEDENEMFHLNHGFFELCKDEYGRNFKKERYDIQYVSWKES